MTASLPQAALKPERIHTRRIPVHELLAHDLHALDTPVFGLMSDDTMLLASALDAMSVPFHTARHENNAIAMADGWASASGELGLALIGRGPATANGLHGAVNVSRTGSKLLLMFGAAPIAESEPGEPGPDGKALDAAAVLKAAGLRTFVMRSAASARDTLHRAIASARRGRAVALLMPVDVQGEEIEVEVDPVDERILPAAGSTLTAAQQADEVLKRFSYRTGQNETAGTSTSTQAPIASRPSRTTARAAPGALAAALGVLRDSRRPLFISGVGAWHTGAKDVIARLAEHTGAILATTLKAKDLFRGHRLNVGVIGSFSHAAGRRLMDQADCIVVFGASFNQRTTSAGAALPAGAPIIHIDLDRSHIGRWGPADVAVTGDAGVVAEQLLEALPARGDEDKPFHAASELEALASFEWSSEFRVENTPRTVDPRALALELDQLLPPDRNLVFDSGNFVQTLPYFSTLGPEHLKLPWDFFSVGMAFGTALGFARARPDSTTVLVIGDGGLLMTLSELETTVREDIPLVIVVMNDCAYGAEMHYLRLENRPVGLAMFPDVDYAPVADAFGFRTATIRTLDQLREAAPLLHSREDGPVLLDCKINASVCGPYIAEAAGHLKK